MWLVIICESFTFFGVGAPSVASTRGYGPAMSEDTQRWTIGDTTVTAIVEAETPGIPVQLFYPDAVAGDVSSVDWLADIPGAATPEGAITFRVQAFVLERAGRTVLVDPCVGNGKQRSLPFWNDLSLPWLERFAAAGFTPEQIDLVVHTHLHEDHLGWDTHRVEGEWVPTFANARHVYVAEELEWAASDARRQQDDPYGDSIEPIVRAGLADVVAADADLGHGLRLLSTPGHTPGHASLVVDSGGEGFIVSGDLLHHPFQLHDPTIAEVGDWDPAMAHRTRAGFFDHCAHAGCVVGGTHFPVAPLGRIEAHGDAWRFRTL